MSSVSMLIDYVNWITVENYNKPKMTFIQVNHIYTQQKEKVNTYSTLIISYTNSIDCKCNIPYEREIPL